MWAGVAGGMAEYFDVDPVLMRLIWVVATVITAGLFVAVYLVMWVIMPLDNDPLPRDWASHPSARASNPGEAEAGASTTPAEPSEPGNPAETSPGAWPDEDPAGPPPYDFPPRERRHHDPWGYGEYRGGRRRRSAGVVLMVLGLLFLSGQAGLFRWINWSVAWAVVLIVLGGAMLLRNSDWRF